MDRCVQVVRVDEKNDSPKHGEREAYRKICRISGAVREDGGKDVSVCHFTKGGRHGG